MKFIETAIQGLFEIEVERLEDERGFFARAFCKKEFAAMNLCQVFVQSNISFNKNKGVIRGMHFQAHPFDEVKLVTCIQGSIFDVAIDMREDSPTYLKWHGCDLDGKNNKSLYVPAGFAHGYQTLETNTAVSYMVSNYYSPSHERGVRYDDPLVNINWPLPTSVMSERDRERKFLTAKENSDI